MALLLAIVLAAQASGGGAVPLAAAPATPPPSPRSSPSSPSASVPTPAFAPDGTLWVVWVDGARLLVASSRDLGRTYSEPIAINAQPEAFDANGEARPKIAVGGAGEVYVSYTRKGEKPYTGDVRFSRRLPDGRFSLPITVNDDGIVTGHRFDTLTVGPSGEVRIFWIDKRNLEHDGAALYEAVSTDGGKTFAANRRIKDHVCECCRLAVAWDGPAPVLLWRDLYPDDVRDHSLLRLGAAKEAAVVRATDDGWKIKGCPHHGPALAVGSDATVHVAWFTGDGVRGKGAYYRRSTDGGRTFSKASRLGTADAGRPQLLAAGTVVWVAWRESTDDGATVVHAMRSADAGRTWTPGREMARTQGASDHPLLAARGEQAFLSWQSKDEGYRVIELSRD
jgi:hypothetical protein